MPAYDARQFDPPALVARVAIRSLESGVTLSEVVLKARIRGKGKMNVLKTTIEFWREGNLYIARSPELDMVAQGNSLEEARQNLFEVIQIQFEEMKELGTLEQFLLEADYHLDLSSLPG
jgi:predicted RNase H-like HicB family nuclease